jgi:hypothetical protein
MTWIDDRKLDDSMAQRKQKGGDKQKARKKI